MFQYDFKTLKCKESKGRLVWDQATSNGRWRQQTLFCSFAVGKTRDGRFASSEKVVIETDSIAFSHCSY